MSLIKVVPVPYPPVEQQMSPRDISHVSDLIIHHTAGALTQTALEIDAEHRAINDAMIAYNRVITPDGTVYMGRPDHFVPAAAFGRNPESINVVLVGNFQSDAAGYTGEPSEEQLDSLEKLCVDLHKQYSSIVRTIGHRDVSPLFYGGSGNYATACPGDKLYAHIPAIRSYVASKMNVH